MKLKAESQIHLNKFKPRDYQFPFSEEVEKGICKKYFLVWPRRCLSGDTYIIMANGSFKRLKDVEEGELIASWDGAKFVPDRVKHKWKTERKPTIKVASSKQPVLTASYDHKFAHVRDAQDNNVLWASIPEINTRRFMLTYAGIDIGSNHKPKLAEFLGYMHSDGYVSECQQPKFADTNIDILKRVEYLAQSLFDIVVTWRKKDNGYDLGLSNGTKGGGTFKNPIKELFRSEDCAVNKEKRRLLPQIWNFDRESTLRFFAALISGDGAMYIAKNGFISDRKRNVPQGVEIAINCGLNHDYAMDIYWLARKLGCLPQRVKVERGSNWKVRISRAMDIKMLLTYPIVGKLQRQQELLQFIDIYKGETRIFNGCHRFRCRYIPGTDQELYDLETENNHNFVANGYLVHNSGKDYTIFNLIVRAALRKVGSYFYCLPTFKQARLVIWDSITINGERFLNCVPREVIKRTNQQEMIIELINGSIIRLIGSDTYDTSLVGTNPLCVVFSEYALADDRAYKYVRPILNANDGIVIICSTPRGRNHFFDLYQIAKNNPKEWYCEKLTINETGHIPIEAIKKDIANGEISEELAQQEYHCSFDMGIEGSYYGRYMDKMRLEGRISQVPWEPAFPVHVSCDLGMRDSTVLVFFQVIGAVIHVIDYYENHSQGLEHYVGEIRNKPYTYGKFIAPHDIQVRELGTGMSRLEKARNFGLNFTIAPHLSINDGIEAVRTTLPKTWIDENNCDKLIRCLENYRKEFDNIRKVYYDKPVHDSFSHGADAWRYACLCLNKLGKETSPEELKERHQKVVYGKSPLPSPFKSPF